MAEARAVKFCAWGDCRLVKDMTNHAQKGRGYGHVTHFCMHNCGLRKISPKQAINWDQQCSWWWTYVSRTV